MRTSLYLLAGFALSLLSCTSNGFYPKSQEVVSVDTVTVSQSQSIPVTVFDVFTVVNGKKTTYNTAKDSYLPVVLPTELSTTWKCARTPLATSHEGSFVRFVCENILGTGIVVGAMCNSKEGDQMANTMTLVDVGSGQDISFVVLCSTITLDTLNDKSQSISL